MNDLKKFMETVILRLESEGRYGTAHVYQSTLNAILRYWQVRQKGTIKLDKVFTPVLLQDFERYLLENMLSMNTVSTYMRMLRAIYHRATKEKGIVRHRIYRRTGRHQTVTDRRAYGKYTCCQTNTPLTERSTVMVHPPVFA